MKFPSIYIEYRKNTIEGKINSNLYYQNRTPRIHKEVTYINQELIRLTHSYEYVHFTHAHTTPPPHIHTNIHIKSKKIKPIQTEN